MAGAHHYFDAGKGDKHIAITATDTFSVWIQYSDRDLAFVFYIGPAIASISILFQRLVSFPLVSGICFGTNQQICKQTPII